MKYQRIIRCVAVSVKAVTTKFTDHGAVRPEALRIPGLILGLMVLAGPAAAGADIPIAAGVETAAIDDGCLKSARTARCKRAIEYQSAATANSAAGCEPSARSARCSRSIDYHRGHGASATEFAVRHHCAASARSGRCSKPAVSDAGERLTLSNL